jgi:hypothetical protein
MARWRRTVNIRELIKYSDYKRFETSTIILYNGADITNNGAPADGQPKK